MAIQDSKHLFVIILKLIELLELFFVAFDGLVVCAAAKHQRECGDFNFIHDHPLFLSTHIPNQNPGSPGDSPLCNQQVTLEAFGIRFKCTESYFFLILANPGEHEAANSEQSQDPDR